VSTTPGQTNSPSVETEEPIKEAQKELDCNLSPLLSIETRRAADELDTEQLVSALHAAGAYLPQTKTSKSMTRAT